MLRDKAEQVKTAEEFTNYFKGLAIVPNGSPGMQAVFGFADSNVVMRLYYHVVNVFKEEKYFDFKLNNSSHQFNQVRSDRSNTLLALFNNNTGEISSANTGNEAYLQSATGFSVKLRFPYLRNLLEINDYVKIQKAELLIKPLQNTYNGVYRLPQQLQLYPVDANNEPGSTFIEGNLVLDSVYGENTFYSFDITAYLQEQITVSSNNKNGLIVLPSSYQTTLNRLIMGDRNNKVTKIQLKIYYVSIQK
jgi:hypothetical protein